MTDEHTSKASNKTSRATRRPSIAEEDIQVPRSRILFQLLLIFMIASALSVIIGISFIKHNIKETANQDSASLAELHQKQKQAKEARLKLEKQAEARTKKFTLDLEKIMRLYQSKRKALPRMIDSYNYETQEYAAETYEIFITRTAPELRDLTSQAIEHFAKNKNLLDPILIASPNFKYFPEYTQWKETHETMLKKYVDYFLKEEETLKTYEQLIKFYYKYFQYYRVDTETNRFIFTSQKAQDYEINLRSMIEQLELPTEVSKQAPN